MQVNVYSSNLYYDAGVIDRLTVMQNVSLWYERFDEADPNLLVNDMTVRCLDEPIIPDNIEYWTVASPNDNHYSYALQSITFGPDGTIVGAGLYVKNNSTVNIAEGKSIISATFTLPQGAGLTYPKSKLTRQIKICGEFVQAYPDGNTGYRVMDTKFTALTNASSIYDSTSNTEGVIAFYTDDRVRGAACRHTMTDALEQFFRIFEHDAVIAGNVRLALRAVDNEHVYFFIRPQFCRGRERSAAHSDDTRLRYARKHALSRDLRKRGQKNFLVGMVVFDEDMLRFFPRKRDMPHHALYRAGHRRIYVGGKPFRRLRDQFAAKHPLPRLHDGNGGPADML